MRFFVAPSGGDLTFQQIDIDQYMDRPIAPQNGEKQNVFGESALNQKVPILRYLLAAPTSNMLILGYVDTFVQPQPTSSSPT